MSKHTHGPWESHQEKNGLFVTAGSFCVANMGDGFVPVQHANAKLVAAAPELLAALEKIENIQNMGQLAYLWDFTIEPLISKAKGE